jgi:hypothetical protein
MEDDDDTEITDGGDPWGEEGLARMIADSLPEIEAVMLTEAVTTEARAAGYARIGYPDHAEALLAEHREQRASQIERFSRALLTRWTRAVGEA